MWLNIWFPMTIRKFQFTFVLHKLFFLFRQIFANTQTHTRARTDTEMCVHTHCGWRWSLDGTHTSNKRLCSVNTQIFFSKFVYQFSHIKLCTMRTHTNIYFGLFLVLFLVLFTFFWSLSFFICFHSKFAEKKGIDIFCVVVVVSFHSIFDFCKQIETDRTDFF